MKSDMIIMVKTSVLYVLGTIIGQGMTFLGVIVFTRIMPKYEYGIYSTYYSVMSIIVVFVGCNLYVALQNAYVDFADNIQEFRKSILILSVVCCTIFGTFLIVINVFALNNIPIYMTAFAVIHGYGFFLVNYRMHSANMEFDYKRKLFLLIAPTTAQFLLSLALVLIFHKNMLRARIVASSLGVMVCGIIASKSILETQGELYNSRFWKYALKISVPSIMMSVSYMIMQQCDKVMITSLVNAEATAEYSVIYYLGFGITAISSAVFSVIQAWTYREIARNCYDKIRIIQKYYLIVMAMIETMVVMVAPELIKLISPPSYWKFEYVAPFVLSAIMMILYGFHTNTCMYYKKTGLVSICVGLSAIVNICLNIVFIPLFGAVAACYTTLVSYIIIYFSTKYVGNRLNKSLYQDVYSYVFFIYSVFICILFSKCYSNTIIRIIFFGSLVLGIIAFMVCKQKEIMETISSSKSK